MNIPGNTLKIIMMPLAVYFVTFIFHRRRSFAITYPGLQRSLCLKYIPAYIIYDRYIYLGQKNIEL